MRIGKDTDMTKNNAGIIMYILIITHDDYGLSSPIKRHRLKIKIKKTD
jgi:hypothetical protein